jgi:hypothetical protein
MKRGATWGGAAGGCGPPAVLALWAAAGAGSTGDTPANRVPAQGAPRLCLLVICPHHLQPLTGGEGVASAICAAGAFLVAFSEPPLIVHRTQKTCHHGSLADRRGLVGFKSAECCRFNLGRSADKFDHTFDAMQRAKTWDRTF